VARKDQGLKGKWVLHERHAWGTEPNVDFIFIKTKEVVRAC